MKKINKKDLSLRPKDVSGFSASKGVEPGYTTTGCQTVTEESYCYCLPKTFNNCDPNESKICLVSVGGCGTKHCGTETCITGRDAELECPAESNACPIESRNGYTCPVPTPTTEDCYSAQLGCAGNQTEYKCIALSEECKESDDCIVGISSDDIMICGYPEETFLC